MRAYRLLFLTLSWIAALRALAATPQAAGQDNAKLAYQKGDYAKAIELLKAAESKDSPNADIQLLLTKSYLELDQYDQAVSSGEKAVAINPKSSESHQWLGEAYGGKAEHASMLSAYPLARKTQKEFEIAVELDDKNFAAAQDLVEYDCSAPGLVGGGEDKARPEIEKLAAKAEEDFDAGLADDLNTAFSLAAIFDLVREVNTAMDRGEFLQQDAPRIVAAMEKFDAILAVLNDDDADRLAKIGFVPEKPRMAAEEIEALIEERNVAKKRRDFKKADEIRQKLIDSGIVIEDSKDGSVRWKYK